VRGPAHACDEARSADSRPTAPWFN